MKPGIILRRVLFLPKRVASLCLRGIQGLPAYRNVVRTFRPGIEIKEADEQDLQQVRAWLNPSSRRPRSTSQSPRDTNWVAKKGDHVIGFVQLVRHPPTHYLHGHWLFSLSVRTPYRRLGIGEDLSRVVMERARQEEVEEIKLIIREDNQPAIKLYRKLGFETTVIPALEAQLEEERYAHGYRPVVMRKALDDKRNA